MLRTLLFRSLAVVALAATVGCASGPKPIYERGWIGGRFETIGSPAWWHSGQGAPVMAKLTEDGLVDADQSAVVLVAEVYEGTPTKRAGVEPGDLLVAIDDTPINSVSEFFEWVDDAKPGSQHTLRIVRRGRRHDLSIVLGRERYQRVGTLSFGFGFSSSLDVIPNPDLDVLGLVRFRVRDDRLELHSPRETIYGWARDPEEGRHSQDGWSLWLGVFGGGKHLKILSQEESGT